MALYSTQRTPIGITHIERKTLKEGHNYFMWHFFIPRGKGPIRVLTGSASIRRLVFQKLTASLRLEFRRYPHL